MTTLNVLFLLPGLGGGGAEMNAVRLSSPLHENGFQCCYVCLSKADDYEAVLHPNSEVVYLNDKPAGSSTIRALQAVRPLTILLNQRNFDVVVSVTNGPFLTMALVRALGHAKRLPTILSVQNAAMKTWLKARGITGRFGLHFWRFVHAQADGAIALTNGVAEDLKRAVPSLRERVLMVHNVGSTLDQAPELEEHNSSSGPFQIVACGRLVPVKGYPDMLRAVAKTARSHDIQLDILGSGPLEGELTTLVAQLGIADKVTFHGFVSEPAKIMRKADLFVLSSHSEGFGNVIIEAMALGIPVLSTDCPYGPGEIIREGESGLLVPVGDSQALSEAMVRMIENPELRMRLSHAARKRAEDFTPNRIGALYAESIKQLLRQTEERYVTRKH